MTHDCKRINKREFTRRIYKHTGNDPLVVTNRGKTESFYASIGSVSSIDNAIGALSDLREEVDDEKEKHNHSS